MPMPTFPLARLGHFRSELHACFTRRADAMFELGDTLLCAPAITSVAQLSLEPSHRRGWGSSYAALARGRIDIKRLRDVLVARLPDVDPLVFAVDVTTWPRCDAECSPERGYYYHPSRHSAGQPIIAGWAYQWIAQLSFDRDSWTAPVDARRLHPLDDTDQTAAAQIRALLGRLPAGQAVPLFVHRRAPAGGAPAWSLTAAPASTPPRSGGWAGSVLLRRFADRAPHEQRMPSFGPARGLEIVDALVSERALDSYPQLPAVRGDLLAKLGRPDEAREQFERAATLTRNERERERAVFLARAAACAEPPAGHAGPGPRPGGSGRRART